MVGNRAGRAGAGGGRRVSCAHWCDGRASSSRGCWIAGCTHVPELLPVGCAREAPDRGGHPAPVRACCTRIPARALHANLVWLLPVHQEFDRPKDQLWQRHGPQWLAILDGIVGRAQSFPLCFRHLVATDSAVIAVAEEPNRLSALRRELKSALRVPGSLSSGELVHMTLFRYARPLRDPALLVRRLAAGVQIDVAVGMVLSCENASFHPWTTTFSRAYPSNRPAWCLEPPIRSKIPTAQISLLVSFKRLVHELP